MTVAVPVAAVTVPSRVRETLRDYVALTKPRIIVLLELTTALAMVIAARGWPGTGRLVLTLVGGWLASGGANAINCWFDRDIDLAMGRTRRRPLPDGRIAPTRALAFGLVMGLAAFLVLALGVNLTAAVLAMAGFFFYCVVYTMVLKRSSPQNIVVGGAAGAIPPLVGWAAVTGTLDPTALFLFAIVFYWTPPHFWALSLLIRRDYAAAKVPMLPVVAGDRITHQNILYYSILLSAVTLLPFAIRSFGILYLVGALILDGGLVGGAVAIMRRPSARGARRLYYYSLAYLALLFVVMAVDAITAGG